MNKEDNSAHSHTEGSEEHKDTTTYSTELEMLCLKNKQTYVKNWTEDFSHENGNYVNNCIKCKHKFMGHKRRVVCKECSEPKEEESQEDQELIDFIRWAGFDNGEPAEDIVADYRKSKLSPPKD
jgi:hypothetical protein